MLLTIILMIEFSLKRNNIFVYIRKNGNPLKSQDLIINLASEIDRKICEVNGLPIPPAIEIREELYQRAKEAKEQAKKANTNKSSLSNSDNSKACGYGK